MRVGIIGFARSGKTTVFNSLTGARAEVGAFGSRQANLAVLKVPDERVDRLAEVYEPKKVTYAEFQFVDIAPDEAAGEEKALSSAAMTALRQVEALVHVVRAFASETVVHPLGGVDAARDCRTLEEEMQLDDLIIIERRLERLEKENKKDRQYELLSRCKTHIEAGKPLRTLELSALEEKDVAGFCFLSRKPLLLLGNYGDERIGDEDPANLQAVAAETGQTLIELCGAMEMEVGQLAQDERAALREELGLGEGSRTRFLKSAYAMLGLISFLTAGKSEVRAWTIQNGTRAQDAAAVIHSDLARGFIRAEVTHYDDFVKAGSMTKAKEAGFLRLEGKDYIVRDGDIMLIRFNV